MQVRNYQKVTHLKWLNLFDISYTGKLGDERSWIIASRTPEPKCISGRFAVPDAVVIVPYHVTAKKWVMTREYRVALADYEYGFPAGLVDDGETIEEAARRELKEETGLSVKRFTANSPPIFSSAGITDESISMVFVDCEGEPSTAAAGNSECIRVLMISREDAADMCRRRDMKFDAKAWLVLLNLADSAVI
jgi:ADP-ribose pyrophosphatase